MNRLAIYLTLAPTSDAVSFHTLSGCYKIVSNYELMPTVSNKLCLQPIAVTAAGVIC